MGFEQQLPEWNKTGAEPPVDKKNEGWLQTEKPPADWFNWLFNRAFKSLEELQSKALTEEDVPTPSAGDVNYDNTSSELSAENVQAAIDENASNHKTHLAESMPHKFSDGGTVYRWGFRTLNGSPQFIYEEVIG